MTKGVTQAATAVPELPVVVVETLGGNKLLRSVLPGVKEGPVASRRVAGTLQFVAGARLQVAFTPEYFHDSETDYSCWLGTTPRSDRLGGTRFLRRETRGEFGSLLAADMTGNRMGVSGSATSGASLYESFHPQQFCCTRPGAIRMRSATKPRIRELRDLPWFSRG